MTTMTLARRQEHSSSWIMNIALLVAVLCLPFGVRASGWVPDADRLFLPALWALVVGMLLARSSLPGWLAWLVGITVGITYSVQYATSILPGMGVLVGDMAEAAGWLWGLVTRETPDVTPFAATATHVVSEYQTTVSDLQTWLVALRAGSASDDVTVLWFLVSLSIWMLTFYATIELQRSQRAVIALLPLGAAIVSNAAITFQALGHVQVFVAAMLIIMAYTNMARMHVVWERFGLDFSSELRRDSMVAGAVIATLAVLVALITPYTTYNRAVYAFWDRYGNTLETFYDDLDRAFAGRSPVNEQARTASRGISLGLLPHDVGLGTSISDRTVMFVTTSDPPPPSFELLQEMSSAESLDPRLFVERRYWRQRTYDLYNGSGWDTSQRNILPVGADEVWIETPYPHTVVTQTFTLVNTRGDIVFAVNQPVSVDGDFAVFRRGDDDFVALSVSDSEYTVVSHAPQPEVEDLQAAETPYDAVIAETFLALPEIPERVGALAQDIVEQAGAVTRYEKARAIEAYLRRYTYDLDVAPPALDQDIVDYFLFEVQRGYCDYSASAMVVMLRSVGVAARYASGYAMGEYDYVQESWVVTGRNAHAWTEVYFPGLGWIEFEPTPTELPRQFAGAAQSFDLPRAPEADIQPAVVQNRGLPWRWIGFGALALALAGVLAVVYSGNMPSKVSTVESSESVRRMYASLARRAAWMRVYPQDGQTPAEFLATLGRVLESHSTAGGALASDVTAIGRAYERARYSAVPLTAQEQARAASAWNRLRPQLTRMVLLNLPKSSRQTGA